MSLIASLYATYRVYMLRMFICEVERYVVDVLDEALQILLPMGICHAICNANLSTANFTMKSHFAEITRQKENRYPDDVTVPPSDIELLYDFFGDEEVRGSRSKTISINVGDQKLLPNAKPAGPVTSPLQKTLTGIKSVLQAKKTPQTEDAKRERALNIDTKTTDSIAEVKKTQKSAETTTLKTDVPKTRPKSNRYPPAESDGLTKRKTIENSSKTQNSLNMNAIKSNNQNEYKMNERLGMFQCADCLQSPYALFPTVCELEAHIASDHLNFFPYECEKCRYAKFPTEYTLIAHYRGDHGMTEFVVKYRYNEEVPQKKDILNMKLQASIHISKNNEANINSVIKYEPELDLPLPVSSAMPTSSNMSPMQVQNPSLPTSSTYLSPIQNEIMVPDEYSNLTVGEVLMKKAGRFSSKKDILKKPGIRCKMCGETVANQRSSKVYHANTRHGKFEMYRCTICDRTWNTIARSDVTKHVKSHHSNKDGVIDMSVLIDNRKAVADKLKKITEKCFPSEKKYQLMGISDGKPVIGTVDYEENTAQSENLKDDGQNLYDEDDTEENFAIVE
ncbi:unnamed protein product [Caenorhabditis bovis]|uniref:C2H2-type domain-containing protein n=1 Tax=Caenorhabditis bovis TaxID=2654633 RepID=A0A8S1ECM3_9PELO|nr:unnamed protein product [Caenorhabditis bovis]